MISSNAPSHGENSIFSHLLDAVQANQSLVPVLIFCVYCSVLLWILALSTYSLLWHLYPGCKCYLALQMVPRLCTKNPNDGCFPKSLPLLLLRWSPLLPPSFALRVLMKSVCPLGAAEPCSGAKQELQCLSSPERCSRVNGEQCWHGWAPPWHQHLCSGGCQPQALSAILAFLTILECAL